MVTKIDEIHEEVKDADFGDASRFKPIPTPKFISLARDKAESTPPQIFAADVVALLHQHANNSQDVQRINGVLRALLAD